MIAWAAVWSLTWRMPSHVDGCHDDEDLAADAHGDEAVLVVVDHCRLRCSIKSQVLYFCRPRHFCFSFQSQIGENVEFVSTRRD